MPQIRKLAPEEVQVLGSHGKSERAQVAEQYDALLSGFELGDWGEAAIAIGENRLTVRNRLTAAASRRALEIDFKRTGPELLRFTLIVPGAKPARAPARTAAPEVVPAPTPKRGRRPAPAEVVPTQEPAAPKRRGRRPKQASA